MQGNLCREGVHMNWGQLSESLHIFQLFQASKRIESNSMPAKDMMVAGPQVFSGAIGIPR